ncbi:polymer-forming cytoskeletal protein [Litorivivens sp.]|uniref:bactofilin family protein n=1 Tax=Litorivivens sp. TaxID=2020868 RepID=UPI0035647629
MGILGRVGKESSDQPGTTVVASGTKIVGDLQLNDDFHLDGRMSGKVNSSLNVSVGKGGEFDGAIQAKKVVISGCVDGTIDAERLEIVSGGRVIGEIFVTELVIEPGGHFSGTSHIKNTDDAEPRRLSHQTATANGDNPNTSDDSLATQSASEQTAPQLT